MIKIFSSHCTSSLKNVIDISWPPHYVQSEIKKSSLRWRSLQLLHLALSTMKIFKVLNVHILKREWKRRREEENERKKDYAKPSICCKNLTSNTPNLSSHIIQQLFVNKKASTYTHASRWGKRQRNLNFNRFSTSAVEWCLLQIRTGSRSSNFTSIGEAINFNFFGNHFELIFSSFGTSCRSTTANSLIWWKEGWSSLLSSSFFSACW